MLGTSKGGEIFTLRGGSRLVRSGANQMRKPRIAANAAVLRWEGSRYLVYEGDARGDDQVSKVPRSGRRRSLQ